MHKILKTVHKILIFIDINTFAYYNKIKIIKQEIKMENKSLNFPWENTLLNNFFFGTTQPTSHFKTEHPDTPYYIFEYVISGKMKFEINNKTYTVNAGDTYIVKKNSAIKYYSVSAKPLKKIWLNADGDLIVCLLKAYKLQDDFNCVFCNTENEIKKIHSLLQLADQSCEITYKFALLLHEIIMKISMAKKQINFEFTPVSDVAVYVKDVIDNTLGDIDYVKRLFCVTDKYIIRKFKEKFGIPPHKYLIQKRIETAKNLLLRTNMSVKEISYQVNFDNNHYFTRIFKKYTGLTPTQYKTQKNKPGKAN